ncbi:acyclic terpene utilization AtuA family protein [Nitrospirillum sp. BR 11752]|uniref:acyclic terpene utilization AtuA family protein n=1 Tax=Nitrospirillum sp. BR 11752 TaxID=3104293 RepID=UPI002EBD6611|nr:acyclic terpene utilization AtuA family protein [Nitrospirillum sp. BR 11752]
MKRVRLGTGAGYSGDRIEPAVELAEAGDIRYLVFECLAERTIALAQLAKRRDPSAGFDPLLVDRMAAVLPACRRNGISIITNMGAANPHAAGAAVAAMARFLGLAPMRIAVVTGDDVTGVIRARGDLALEETGAPVSGLSDSLVSANAYLGADPIVRALKAGADVVITGRVADPSLFLAPLIHEFGWAADDWSLMGKGTLVGHLMECAGQVSGGYFADPGYKDVLNLARLGFPIAEVGADGAATITKVAGSGGLISAATCREQLLYEVHDPARYLTPDVTADFSGVTITELGHDRVRVAGAQGDARPDSLKVSLGYSDGYIGEGQISYAGPGALARARLARDIVAERLRIIGLPLREVRLDLIGVDAIHGPELSATAPEPYEVRLRVAGRTHTLKEAERIGNEVEGLYTNGPAGGGGATKTAKEVIAVQSTLIPRDLVTPQVHLMEVTP